MTPICAYPRAPPPPKANETVGASEESVLTSVSPPRHIMRNPANRTCGNRLEALRFAVFVNLPNGRRDQSVTIGNLTPDDESTPAWTHDSFPGLARAKRGARYIGPKPHTRI